MKIIKLKSMINEGDAVLEDYWANVLLDNPGGIQKQQLKIGKLKFQADEDRNSGSISWGVINPPEGQDYLIYATPAWEGSKYIEFEDGASGKQIGKVPLKTTKNEKKDFKWYIDTIKKTLPKVLNKAESM